MGFQSLIPYLPLLAMLTCVAAVDLRSRRIPNSLTLMIVASGIMLSFTRCATASPGQSLLGMLAGGGMGVALLMIGALGGGDVKLLAGVGAWLGTTQVFEVFLAEAVVGMLIVTAQCAARGRLRLLCRNSAVVAINLVHIQQLGTAHASATGESCRSVDKPLPYAVPVLVATVLVLLLNGRVS